MDPDSASTTRETRASPPIPTSASVTSRAGKAVFVAEGKVVLDLPLSTGRFAAESGAGSGKPVGRARGHPAKAPA